MTVKVSRTCGRVWTCLVTKVPMSEVYSTSGQHDLLAKFNLPRDADIGTFVTKQVQTRPHVRDTFTVITFSPFLPSKG
jgi:DNA-binding Lrp family transcriptional regulator